MDEQRRAGDGSSSDEGEAAAGGPQAAGRPAIPAARVQRIHLADFLQLIAGGAHDVS